MGTLDTINHLLNFGAPALVMALVLPFGSRVLFAPRTLAPSFFAQSAVNFAACIAALLVGLWFFGRDGTMAAYGSMVLAGATTQWLMQRGWTA